MLRITRNPGIAHRPERRIIVRVDEIRRELVVEAPIERVWNALTSAEELAQWFGDSAEIELEPGGRARIGWSDYDSITDCIVEVVDRPTKFSFRWEAISGTPVEVQSTLVEFTLRQEGDSTHVTLLEIGFADLPDEVYEERLAKNSSGWDAELDDLQTYLAA
jgi:uncharacterized protein YndB with AHSA1/START domain